ncbi:MAG: LysM peptidoglycan-binding domain-containing protein [Flavobacteriales bacterium]|nr:LysM peptidoglycan-binding domain-containing protein [Flavobacteriales bacterium]
MESTSSEGLTRISCNWAIKDRVTLKEFILIPVGVGPINVYARINQVLKSLKKTFDEYLWENAMPQIISENPHTVKLRNGIKSVIAIDGDTPKYIAYKLSAQVYYIYKWNDLKKGDEFRTGQIIYLETKKKSGEKDYHVVTAGENMYDISQKYGIKLASLYKLNGSVESPLKITKVLLR